MNVLIIDTQALLSEQQTLETKNRIYYSLARFAHRINGVTAHISAVETSSQVACCINVNLEGAGIITVRQRGEYISEVLNLTLTTAESKVAYRVDWRGRWNPETCATWMNSLSKPIWSAVSLFTNSKKKGCRVDVPGIEPKYRASEYN